MRRIRIHTACPAVLSLVGGCAASGGLAPLADAGPDQFAGAGESVALDGSASLDADGVIEAWRWRVVGRPARGAVTISNGTSPFPVVTVETDGTWLFELRVTDDEGLQSAPDLIAVIATGGDERPVASLVVDGDGRVGAPITLDGRGSSDPEGAPLSWHFSIQVAPPGSFSAIDTAGDDPTAEIEPDAPGTWVFGLAVDDGLQRSARVDAILTVVEE